MKRFVQTNFGLDSSYLTVSVFLWLTFFDQITLAQLTADEKDIFLQLHNQKRAAVQPSATNMMEVTWNEELERVAQSYAEKCPETHSQDNYFGENLAWGAWNGDIPRIMKAWVEDEAQFYDFETSSCLEGEICGHYTTVVWAQTSQMGCGKYTCGQSEYYVCNYNPAGNYPGVMPYERGPTASNCPPETQAINGLCSHVQAPAHDVLPDESGSSVPALFVRPGERELTASSCPSQARDSNGLCSPVKAPARYYMRPTASPQSLHVESSISESSYPYKIIDARGLFSTVASLHTNDANPLVANWKLFFFMIGIIIIQL